METNILKALEDMTVRLMGGIFGFSTPELIYILGLLFFLVSSALITYIFIYLDVRRHTRDMRLKGWQYWLNLALFLLVCSSMPFLIVFGPFSYFWFVPSIMALAAWEGATFYCIYPAVRKIDLHCTGRWFYTPFWTFWYWAGSFLVLACLTYVAVLFGQR